MTYPHTDPDFLDDLDRSYGEAPAPEVRSNDVLRGTYQAEIIGAVLEQGKGFEGSDRLSFELRIFGPADVGRHVWRNHSLRTDGIEWLKKDLYTLGLPNMKPSKLYDGTERAVFLGRRVNIKCDVNAKGYQVVYFNSLISDGAGSGGYDERNPPPVDDDVPNGPDGRPLF